MLSLGWITLSTLPAILIAPTFHCMSIKWVCLVPGCGCCNKGEAGASIGSCRTDAGPFLLQFKTLILEEISE